MDPLIHRLLVDPRSHGIQRVNGGGSRVYASGKLPFFCKMYPIRLEPFLHLHPESYMKLIIPVELRLGI
jgi:hypothetical protein